MRSACKASVAVAFAVVGCSSPTNGPGAVFTLEIASGVGSGHVAGPDGVDCSLHDGLASGACIVELPGGTVASLVATPVGDHAFANWTEGGSVASATPSTSFSLASDRALVVNFHSVADRPDDASGALVHVMYVLPADGTDAYLDVDGTLERSTASLEAWLTGQAGLGVRFDRFSGELDTSFARLSQTDSQMRAYGPLLVVHIELELLAAGRIDPDKRYLVYYDGGSTYSCGGAAWPPNVPGQIAALYLRGTPPGTSCTQPFVSTSTGFPRYWEFAALHDLLHTLGIVATDAPNHTAAYPAHVPEPNDLMYSGPDPWILSGATTIDVGRDDYFDVGVASTLPTLEQSPFLFPAGTVATLVEGEGTASPSTRLGSRRAPPPHPPLLGEPPR
jgi:hypothetical protein